MKKTALALVALCLVSSTILADALKEIRFGVDASYAPFESKTADGRLTGFDIDLGNEICKRLNTKCVWVENDFDGMIPALKAKKFDGILSSLSVTSAREKEISFSDKLFDAPTRMIARKGSRLLPTAGSLKGKRVGVEQGTTQEAYAKARLAPQGVDVIPYQNQVLVLNDLQSGRLDAALQDAVQAEEGFLKKPEGAGFAFAGPVVHDPKTLGTGTAIGLRKQDTALKADIDKAIAGMLKDGTYRKLAARYFDFDIYGS